MKHSRFLFVFSFLFFSVFSFSQSISGTIKNDDHSSFPFVEVVLSSSEKTYSTITDEFGNYKFEVPENGMYRLKVFINENLVFDEEITIHATTSKNISIAAKTKEIQGVTLIKRKKLVEHKVDRIVFNVENSVNANGGDALDALKITPKVRIQNGKISLIGKNSVKVMINEKIVPLSGEELTNYLKSIPGANIQKIEVITTPPARYDAEGNSGIINIQLKNTKQDSWNIILRTNYEQANYPRTSNGINFSYKKNRLSVLSDFNYRHSNRLYTNKITYDYPNEDWKNTIWKKSTTNGYSALFNLQYDLSETKNIGFQYLGYKSQTNSTQNNSLKSYKNNILLKDYPTSGNSDDDYSNHSLNLNYAQKLDSIGKKFVINLDYLSVSKPSENTFVSDQYDLANGLYNSTLVNNSSEQDIENYSGKTDFDMPFDLAKIDFGAKVSSTKIKTKVHGLFYNNSLIPPTLKREQYDRFNYTENTQSLYFSINKEFWDKLEAKLGLRGEYTQHKANSISGNEINSKNYLRLFPTAYLSYKIDESNTLSASFSRRIHRPAFWHLNPARQYDTENSYSEGNPFLEPSFSYNYELKYVFKDFLSINLYTNDLKNDYNQATYHDTATNTQVFKMQNYYDQLDIGGGIELNMDLCKFWNTSSELDVYCAETQTFIPIYDRNYFGWGGSFSSNNTFALNAKKTISASLYYQYNYPEKIGEGRSTASSTVNIGFRFLVLDKKLNIGLNFNDIFKKDYSTFQSVSGGVKESFKQYYDTRYVRLSLSYNIGNKNIALNKRKQGNEEEKNRMN